MSNEHQVAIGGTGLRCPGVPRQSHRRRTNPPALPGRCRTTRAAVPGDVKAGPHPARPATAQDTDRDTGAARSGVVVAVLSGEEY
ncbi:MAG TPA: hypothetical protein VHV74_00600 [Pseudonocardiaceae bacterium]|jgi:hypothetical protein|nr:hypothetical protein [Pseudonocardiaceae bacterium]